MAWHAHAQEVPDRCLIDSLDDGCLTRIFRQLDPLDRYRAAATCRRYRDVVREGRLWLFVSKSRLAKRLHRHVYPTLQAAVDDSRPGETIMLEAGEPHDASNVVIKFPLHLIGGGDTPSTTVLRCSRGALAALDFRASGKVANLTVQVSRSACIRHQQGRVWVEQCSLECDPGGLPHLFSAIVSCASGHPSPAVSNGTTPMLGAISVVETRIQGGSSAVKTLGTGVLQSVRCIYRAAHIYFWLEVAQQATSAADARAAVTALETYNVDVAPAACGAQSQGRKRTAEQISEDDAEVVAEKILDQRARAWLSAHCIG